MELSPKNRKKVSKKNITYEMLRPLCKNSEYSHHFEVSWPNNNKEKGVPPKIDYDQDLLSIEYDEYKELHVFCKLCVSKTLK